MKKILLLFFIFLLTLLILPNKILAQHVCNQRCTASSCRSGLACINGICRNPSCPADTDCVCPTPTPTNTPTPTPTPTNTPTPTPTQAPWKKSKDASFQSSNNLINHIPLNPIAYDSDDDNSPFFIIGKAGVISVPSFSINFYNPSAKISFNNQYNTPYTPSILFNKSNFLEYIKSRKEYKTISDINQINANGTFNLLGNLTIDNNITNNVFNGKKLVLIVEGNVFFNLENFIPTNSAVAILANTINFYYSSTFTREARGIFVADTINTGNIDNIGLKIVGNLITNNLNNLRSQYGSNNRKPSIFIVFDPRQYLNLLPYLSISKYEWRQLQ